MTKKRGPGFCDAGALKKGSDGVETGKPNLDHRPALFNIAVDHRVTVDMANGAPLPPFIDDGVIWCAVRRARGRTLWRRLSLTNTKETAAMTATSYSYPHRHERDEIVDYLAEKFPKCFFSAPNLRRPLKRNIIEDLDRLGVLNTEKLRLAIGWYQSNFTYQRTIIAGAERIDLEGRKAGTVTETEAREARNFIFERKVESEAVKKAAASAVPAPQPPLHLRAVPATDTSNKPALHPSLTAIQAAIDAANRLAGDSTFSGSLRVTLITAALQEVAHAADAAIGVLRDNSTTKED